MKKIGLFVLLAVLALGVSMYLGACSGGGGSSSSSSSSSSSGTTSSSSSSSGTIQNTASTQQASTGTQASNIGTGSATLFNQLGLSQIVGAPRIKIGAKAISDPALAKAASFAAQFSKAKGVAAAAAAFRKAKTMNTVATSGTISCTYSGTIDFSTSASGVTMTFNTCREDGLELTGTAAVSTSGSGSTAVYTETLGTSTSRLVMLSFSDNTYTVMTSKLSSAVTLSLSGSASSASMAANGDMAITDYSSGDIYTLAYNQTTFGFAESGTGLVTDVITMGGGVTETWTPSGGTLHSFAVTFTSFTITDVYATAGAAAYDESISGGMTITMVPADCGDGAFTFTTNTPVHYDANGITQSGQMIIAATKSGVTTTVRITFVANGLVNIELQNADGTYTSVQSGVDPYSLANLCGVETPNEPAPVSSGSSGTTTGNASNASFTATLSWDGPTSDMDLHLVHLTSVPTTTTISSYSLTSSGATADSDWHLYYDSGPGGGCATSENYVGTASAKVAVLDVDKCYGLGPEHITMDAPLAAGYYMLYVDPFSMHSDTQTTVTVKLQIGGQLFTAHSPVHYVVL